MKLRKAGLYEGAAAIIVMLVIGALTRPGASGTAPATRSEFQVAAARSEAGVESDTAQAKLAIRGMTCGSCAVTARLALRQVPGVYDARVSYDSASAVVLYDPARTSPERFIARLQELTGFKASWVPDPPRDTEP